MSLPKFHKKTHSRDIPTLVDCGCEAVIWNDGSGVEIEYCTMHAAAPEMLDALKEIAKTEGPYARDPKQHADNVICNMASIANKAIAKAEEEK